MPDTPKTEILRARGILLLDAEDGRPAVRDRNGNEMLRAEAVLMDGSRKRILAFDKPKGADALAASVATDLVKAVAAHQKRGMPPTEFTLRVRKMPEAINPATNKPYRTSYVVDSFSTTPLDRLPQASKPRDDEAR
jgi:hypothetical protein